MSKDIHKIKAKSHILNLLGNQLIGNDGLAIFELVKNSYDADADEVKINFIDLNTASQKIVIEDDGHGMSPEVINNIWLTIGTDSKRGQNRKPSPKYGRISLGNKGVGRLAVHKLARKITLQTQVKGNMFSNQFSIDWKELIESKEYFQDLEVEVVQIGEPLFKKGHGTRIILSGLYNTSWSKLALRDLIRKIENIKNPFNDIENFKVEIDAGQYNKWLEGLKSSTEILNDSLYQFKFSISVSKQNELLSDNAYLEYLFKLQEEEKELHKTEEYRKEKNIKLDTQASLIEEKKKEEIRKHLDSFSIFKWSYKFNPPSLSKIQKKEIAPKKEGEYFIIGDLFLDIDKKRSSYLRNRDLINIGNYEGRFYVFNQTSEMLNYTSGGQVTAVKEYIKDNCGIKVYRDNIRVYNYGEPSDDWLRLDLMKIQRTGDHFGKKVTIGAIELNLEQSELGLQEKTNREGFDENYYYTKFQRITNQVYQFFERESQDSKELVDEFIKGFKTVKRPGFSETLEELNNRLAEKQIQAEFTPLLKRLEKDYSEMRDIMLNSGITGLNLAVVFHEVDREMRFINSDLNIEKVNIEKVQGRIKNLIQLLDRLSPLLRQNKNVNINASELAKAVIDIHRNRFKFHNIIFSSPLISKENPDFSIKGPGNLLSSMLSNLIDNAIYWTTIKREHEGNNHKCGIYLGTDINSFDGPAIIVADNGLGFSLDPEILVQPFKTFKPGGMGLGLYYTSLVMNMIGGKILFPDAKDLEIPNVYDGACIALVFPKFK